MEVSLIPALNDNYIFHILTDDGLSVIVDAGTADPVIEFLEERNLPLHIILHTHHHWDHIDGDPALQKKYECEIWGPEHEIMRIPNMNVLLEDNQTYTLGAHNFQVIHTPGHTRGHICLYFQNENILFAGDTLFSLGCGRLFEGTPEEMWRSLQTLRALPDETSIYCAHEYTKDNAQFWKSIEPNHPDIENVIKQLNVPTIPSTIGFEKKYNPFLRADDADLANALEIEGQTPDQRFKYIRERKDSF